MRRIELQNPPTWVPVVAAMLVDENDLILLQKRPTGKAHAGLWEFPGGKVESAENQRDALLRELEEELAITVRPCDMTPVSFAEELPDNRVVLFLYKVTSWVGEPVPTADTEIVWAAVSALKGFDMPPLDLQLRSQVIALSAAGVL